MYCKPAHKWVLHGVTMCYCHWVHHIGSLRFMYPVVHYTATRNQHDWPARTASKLIGNQQQISTQMSGSPNKSCWKSMLKRICLFCGLFLGRAFDCPSGTVETLQKTDGGSATRARTKAKGCCGLQLGQWRNFCAFALWAKIAFRRVLITGLH